LLRMYQRKFRVRIKRTFLLYLYLED
jgi:hypothetical protein